MNIDWNLSGLVPSALSRIAFLLRAVPVERPTCFWAAWRFAARSWAGAVQVFTPKNYETNLSSPELAERFHREMVDYKHKNLKRAHLALLAGFLPLMISVVYYLRLMDGPG